MTFVFAESGRRYDAEDLALAEELGRRAGLALSNAQLHEQAQATNLRLRRLQAVTDVALNHLDLEELLRELLHRVRDAIAGDVAAVLLLHEERGELRLRAGVGLEGPDDVPVPLGRGIAGRIAKLRRPMVIDDVAAHDVVSAQLRASAASLVGVPLLLGRRVIGVLHVGSRERRAFTQEDVRLLELVADRAARAIDHARLYEQARDTALTLQHSLLPLALPAIPGYDVAARYLPGESGTQVGGDWYDVFPLRDGRFGLVVGDVVGRGVPAAAGMGQLRAALQALLWDAGDPARAMEILDGVVEALGQVTFATVVALALDPATGEGSLCTAGHPPPVVRADDGSATVLLGFSTGPPLSALPGRPREASPIRLEPGETLLLYTDGLVERRRISLDERLGVLEEAVASGPQVPGALLEHLTATLIGAERSYDDTAIVALRRLGGTA